MNTVAEKKFDIVFIGSGPGGYVGAIRASQLINKKTGVHFTVACIEKDDLGGTCLNCGCIPTKALLTSTHYLEVLTSKHIEDFGITVSGISADFSKMSASKEKTVLQLRGGIGMLFKGNKVEHIEGLASFIDKNNVSVSLKNGQKMKIHSEHFIIATGSYPLSLPGIKLDEQDIMSSTLALKDVPKDLIVIGAGVIGLELGSVFARLGTKVTMLDYAHLAASTMDHEISRDLMKSLSRKKGDIDGLKFELGVAVNSVTKNGNGLTVSYTPRSDDANAKVEKKEIHAEKVLMAVGRGAYIEGLNLSAAGIEYDEKTKKIITKHLKTNIDNIYAIGDVTSGPMLAHKAEEEGVMAAEMIAGQHPILGHFIPAVIYTHPEAASIGATEEELKAAKKEYVVGKAIFASNGRAKTLQDTEGFVKILCDKDCNEILGAHILHSSAGTLINELAAYLAYSPCSPDDIALTCHSHPDLNEVIKAAALDALDRPLSAMPKKKKVS